MKAAVCKQKPNENVEEFAVRIKCLMEPLKSKAEDPATQKILMENFEQDLLAYFKNGLSPQIKTFVQLADPNSFEEALEKAEN